MHMITLLPRGAPSGQRRARSGGSVRCGGGGAPTASGSHPPMDTHTSLHKREPATNLEMHSFGSFSYERRSSLAAISGIC